MTNRLASETSPYLLQHAENPVDWQPWDDAALAAARQADKPIFLSIGYSACHWCHVMEHESFENEALAARLNEGFVCIKVDREERPDLDQLYMQSVQMIAGRGGWPMSVFLTPDLAPFFGGTYWPPHASRGMPGFDQVLESVLEAWNNRREQVVEQAGQISERLRNMASPAGSGMGLNADLFTTATAQLERVFDYSHGGIGGAPKFPQPMTIQLLLRIWRRHPRQGVLDMVRLTLDKMSQGGIYDHLGGGFARYSVDERWLVPHFEKMLYDNALLAGAYLDAYVVTKQKRYAETVRHTLDYVLRDLTDPAGGFHSTEDADSEGEEGRFYVWTPRQIEEVLGAERSERFCYVYDVTESGNFEGRNILNLPKTIEQCAALRGWSESELRQELEKDRTQLLEARNRRVHPAKDDKILTSWNGLMIESLARAAGILDEPRYLTAAAKACEFLLENLRNDDGRLLHVWRAGRAKYLAYLDDYANVLCALLALYEADFQEKWIDQAVQLADVLLQRFRDHDGGGFFYVADDSPTPIVRTKELHDSSTPSGNAMAAIGLIRLGKLCGRADYLTAASETLDCAAGLLENSPTAAAQMLAALDMHLGPVHEIVILGDITQDDTREVVRSLRRSYLPNRVVACRAAPDDPAGGRHVDPIFIGKTMEGPPPTVYLCEQFACQPPIRGKAAILNRWKAMSASALGD